MHIFFTEILNLRLVLLQGFGFITLQPTKQPVLQPLPYQWIGQVLKKTNDNYVM